MQTELFVAVALAGAVGLGAGWAGMAQTQPANAAAPRPEAADQTLGMALMSAFVDANGNLLRGDGAIGAKKNDTGFYQVSFNRSIGDCTPVATGNSKVVARVGFVSVGPSDTVQTVLTHDLDGNDADGNFALFVFCAR